MNTCPNIECDSSTGNQLCSDGRCDKECTTPVSCSDGFFKGGTQGTPCYNVTGMADYHVMVMY